MLQRAARCAALFLGSVLALLTMAGCAASPIELSPDGSRAIVSRGPDEAVSLLNTRGKGAEPLAGTEGGHSPKWSPSGDHILFATEAGVSVYDAANSRLTPVAEGASPPYSWSPDSSRFTAYHAAADGGIELRIYAFPGGSSDPGAPLPFSAMASAPLWLTGDGDLAVLGPSDAGQDVYLIQGVRVRPLTTSGDVLGLGLSPDGEILLWARPAPSRPGIGLALVGYELRRGITAALPFPERLSPIRTGGRGATPAPYGVSFSPDGNRMTVAACIGPNDAVFSGLTGDYVLRQVQRRARRKTSDDTLETGAFGVHWSQDSRRMAVVDATRQSAFRIYKADGRAGRKVVLPPPAAG